MAVVEEAIGAEQFQPVLLHSLVRLGGIEAELGNDAAAEQIMNRAVATWQLAPDAVDPQLVQTALDLGRWLAERGHCAEAVPLLHRATKHAANSRATVLESLLAGCS